MSPLASTTQLPRRKSPCTTVLSVCSGMRARPARSWTRSTTGRSRVFDASYCACQRFNWRRDELVAPGEVAEPDRVDVDGVEGDERVDQRPARVGARFRVERPLGGGDVVQDDAGDVRHHVERRADHVRVGADGHRLAGRDRCRPERVDDAVLAAHVVRGREDAVQRWAAHHELAAVGVGHVRGDVRLAAGDELGAERCRESGQLRPPPSAANESRSIPVGAPPARLPAREARWPPLGDRGHTLAEVVGVAQALLLACSARRRRSTRSARSPRIVSRIESKASGADAAISAANAVRRAAQLVGRDEAVGETDAKRLLAPHVGGGVHELERALLSDDRGQRHRDAEALVEAEAGEVAAEPGLGAWRRGSRPTSARPRPPPTAAPCTAATIGFRFEKMRAASW